MLLKIPMSFRFQVEMYSEKLCQQKFIVSKLCRMFLSDVNLKVLKNYIKSVGRQSNAWCPVNSLN